MPPLHHEALLLSVTVVAALTRGVLQRRRVRFAENVTKGILHAPKQVDVEDLMATPVGKGDNFFVETGQLDALLGRSEGDEVVPAKPNTPARLPTPYADAKDPEKARYREGLVERTAEAEALRDKVDELEAKLAKFDVQALRDANEARASQELAKRWEIACDKAKQDAAERLLEVDELKEALDDSARKVTVASQAALDAAAAAKSSANEAAGFRRDLYALRSELADARRSPEDASSLAPSQAASWSGPGSPQKARDFARGALILSCGVRTVDGRSLLVRFAARLGRLEARALDCSGGAAPAPLAVSPRRWKENLHDAPSRVGDASDPDVLEGLRRVCEALAPRLVLDEAGALSLKATQDPDAAATKLQARLRGRRERRHPTSPPEKTKRREDRMATRLQARYRGHHERSRPSARPEKTKHREDRMATRLQSRYRGHHERSRPTAPPEKTSARRKRLEDAEREKRSLDADRLLAAEAARAARLALRERSVEAAAKRERARLEALEGERAAEKERNPYTATPFEERSRMRDLEMGLLVPVRLKKNFSLDPAAALPSSKESAPTKAERARALVQFKRLGYVPRGELEATSPRPRRNLRLRGRSASRPRRRRRLRGRSASRPRRRRGHDPAEYTRATSRALPGTSTAGASVCGARGTRTRTRGRSRARSRRCGASTARCRRTSWRAR